ncbi:tRNA pseudouridine(13) synthase TruD [Eionea flava]
MSSAFAINFPTVYPSLSLSAQFRQSPQDFYVEEQLGFELSGSGEHQCIEFEKTGHNTHWVIAALAEHAQVSERDIGYCGRKDRHAVTRQWASIYCPPIAKHRQEADSTVTPLITDWAAFRMEGVRILSIKNHHKKLRLGDHESNRFCIALHDVSNPAGFLSEAEKKTVLTELKRRLSLGVPNYFGEQRFGRGANNLVLANQWLLEGISPPRKQRSMILSAARSYIFNTLLAYRVRHQQWNQTVDGDVVEGDYPTGPLWGRGRSPAQGAALDYEQEALHSLLPWCEKLEYLGLQQERRALVLVPRGFEIHWKEESLLLSFSLPTGTFATSVLAEVATCIDPRQQN